MTKRARATMMVETIEPRVLYSADPLAASAITTLDAPDTALLASLSAESDVGRTDSSQTSQATSASTRELVIVDSGVEDADALVDALIASRGAGLEILMLDAGPDALGRIGEHLAQGAPVAAVHLIAHGEPGALLLGGERLDADGVEAAADTLSAWATSLTTDADLLLYGCDLASREDGLALIARLAALTGADVAASDDPTGAATLGGDWTLEVAVGSIEARLFGASSADAALASWQHTLGDVTVSTTADIVDGDTSSIGALIATPGADGSISLREAVLAAGAAPDADVITLGAAYYSLADAALQGALTINGAVTIRGDTDTTTVIDAMALDRAFELAPDSTLVLEDVYLFNGDATGDGGLILVGVDARLVGNRITLASGHTGGSGGAIASDGGAVVLVDTLVTNNAADDDGGGIRIAAGTLELDRVTFAFNAASASGGGVSIATGPGAATMRNATFWQNAASTLGGAISTERALSVSHTTIGQNTASVAGGGFHIGAGGSVSLRMSIVADNVGGNSDGAVVSDDYNIDSGTTLGLNRSHDLSSTAPEFYGYGDFGGHIPSVAINPWSPAIDAGSSSGTPILDQRGGARDGINLFDWYGDPDIGSYEYDASDAVVPPTADAGAAQTILEGGSVTFDASASVDNYGGSMRYRWDLDNDGQFDDASSKTASLSWAALQSLGLGDDGTYTVRLRVENTYLGDGAGNWSEAVTTLTVRNLAPVLSVSGAASVEAGAPYSLTLSAADPGDDTIASWLVDWGDGSVETIAATGATTVTTHQYAAGGFTRDILVSATDDDGTWFSNELLVGVDGSETIERFEAMTGTLLGSFEPRLELNNPRSLTIGPDGLLYVASTADASILRYDPASGAFIDAFIASGAGGLVSGEGPAFGPDGNLYVGGHAGGVVDQVLRFDGTSGNPLGTAVAAGDHGTGYLPEPAFGPDGLLYIADQTSGAIRRYVATTGVWVDDFIAPGQISNIGDIAWGPDGYLYVTDVDDHSIQRFDASTGVRDPIAFVASGAGGLTTPWRMAFGPDGNLYVTSTDSHTIKRYSGTDGSFIDDYASNPAWGGGVAPLSLTFRPSLQVAVSFASTAPVLSGIETTPVVYMEDAPSVAISNTIDISDPDSVLLAQASVTIGAGFHVGADVLAVDAGATLNGALSVSWDPVGGVLTISGNANVIAYRNALRSIVFSNTSQAPDETDRRIDFLVDDGSSSSNIASRIVQVQAVDDPPAIVSTSAGATIYDEGSGSVVLDTTIDIADVDSPNLRQATIMMTGGGVDDTALLEFTPLGNVDGGWDAETRTLTLIGEDSVVIWRDVLRSVSFRNDDENALATSYQIAYAVFDGTSWSSPLTHQVDFVPIDDPPALADIEPGALAYTEGDGARSITDTITVADVDDASIQRATITISAGYQNGADRLEVAPLPGMTTTWIVNTATLTVIGPASLGDFETVLRAVTFSNTSANPVPGDRVVTFRVESPNGAFSGEVSRTVTVSGVNDAPIVALAPGPIPYAENAASALVAPGATVTDVDSPDFAGGRLALALASGADGTESLDIVAGGPDAVDRLGNDVRVGGVVVGTASGGVGGSALVIDFTAGATPGHVAAVLARVGFAATGDSPTSGARGLVVSVTDPGGASSTPQSVTVDVTAVADLPQVGGLDTTTLDYVEGDGLVAIAPSVLVSDPDTPLLVGSRVQIGSGYAIGQDRLELAPGAPLSGNWNAATGTLELVGTASAANVEATLRAVRFTNDSEAPSAGLREIVLVVDDGSGPAVQATRRVNVIPVNDAPVFGDGVSPPTSTYALPEQSSGVATLVATDLEGDALSFSIAGGADAANFVLDPASGALSFVAPPVFSAPTDANADNVHELVVAVTDAQGATSTLALTVRVTDLEFAPTLTIGQPLLLGSGGEVVLTDAELSATDADDALGTLRFVLDRLPQHGDLTRDGSALAIGDAFGMDEVMAGRIRYASSESIADSLALHVVDPGGARSASASLTITVVALQAPVVVTQPQAEAAASAAAAPAQAASDAPAAGQPAGETGAAIATLDDRPNETDRKNTRSVDVVLVADLDLSASLPTAGEQGSVRAVVSASIQRSDTAAAFTPPSLVDTLRFAPAEAGGTGTPTSTLGAAEIRGTERFQAAVSSRAWQAELDRAREEATRETTLVGTLTGGSAAVVGSLSVGYVFWLLRGGMLLTSLLTTIPAWYALDPMPVLSRRGAELDDEAGDRVEGLFGDARRARSATPTAGSGQRAVPEVGTVDAAAQAQGAEDR